tara:strand:+ start:276 stop:896 length:621 start_codon:yes stop_codon:yes gene_type:complete
MRFKVTTGPASEPISTAEAKTQLRIDGSSEDTLIGEYIKAARGLLERQMRRAFITQTITLKLDKFPTDDGKPRKSLEQGFGGNGTILLPRSPAIAITSVQYVDTNGATQTLSSSLYEVDTTSEPARLHPAYDEDWPDTREIENAVTVTYTAGYGAASDVPEELRLAIRLLVGVYFEQREAISTMNWQEVPLGLQALVAAYTVPEIY